MPSVSAIVLTKNSERTIEACVKALKPAVDHVIVVDTGSSDSTVQIAKDSGAHVYHFEWRDDFSAARNFGDSLATTEWSIHVDSDEILRSEDTNKIRQLCSIYKKTIEPVAVNILQINIMEDRTEIAPATRLYKRGVLIWNGIVHEHLVRKRGELFYVKSSDVGVLHDGYNSKFVNVRDKAISRNIRLLRKGIEQEPENIRYQFSLGRDLLSVGSFTDAVPHLKRAIELCETQGVVHLIEDAKKYLGFCLDAVKNQ